MENKNTNIPGTPIKERKTILIIDDSDSVRSFIKSILEKEYEIVDKNDGHEALVYLSQNHHPDLILSDMEMPNMNGRAFVRRVKSDPRHAKIPIVFITSVNSSLIINSFANMGVVDFIIKPFKPDELIAKVNDIFSLKN
jgi:CheY-like chemotaxis protein